MSHPRKKVYLPGSPGFQRQQVHTTLTVLKRVSKEKPFDPIYGWRITKAFYRTIGDLGPSNR